MSTTTSRASGRKALRLLVVDDSATMRRVIVRAARLTRVPIETVFEAGNGRHALDILAREPVDAVITDVNMPEMGGIELLRQIAARPDLDHVLRIVVSTDGSECRRSEAAQFNVQLYLEKPFRPEAIRDALAELAGAA
jgi:two-component system chemotaxis response regulator CheY